MNNKVQDIAPTQVRKAPPPPPAKTRTTALLLPREDCDNGDNGVRRDLGEPERRASRVSTGPMGETKYKRDK